MIINEFIRSEADERQAGPEIEKERDVLPLSPQSSVLSPDKSSVLSPDKGGLYIRTFGCQMNEYDSLQVQTAACRQGYVPVDEIGQADVIFLNTCSVRGKAEQKVHSFLGRLRRLKESKPHLKIIAGGCVAQQLGEKLLAQVRSPGYCYRHRGGELMSVNCCNGYWKAAAGSRGCRKRKRKSGTMSAPRAPNRPVNPFTHCTLHRDGPGYYNAGMQQLLFVLHSALRAGSGTEQTAR